MPPAAGPDAAHSADDAPPRVLRTPADAPDPAVVAEAARVLLGGGLVGLPTETVYGLAANALDPAAVARIFAAKGRPAFNPLIAHVPDADAALALVATWPEAATRLAERFWPGPLTLVLPKRPDVVPDAVTAGLPAVAVRVPAHPVALAVLRAAGVPAAAPSANRHTELSPTRAEHVVRALGGRVDLVVDAGPSGVGIESAVVDLTETARTGAPPRVLRPGTLSADAIAAALGMPSGAALGDAAPAARPDAPRLSPGMVERHYAPRAAVWPADAGDRAAAARRLREARGARPGLRAGALLLAPWGESEPIDSAVRMPDDPAAYARALYAALHAIDERGCDVVLVDAPPAGPAWAGVRDRLARATR